MTRINIATNATLVAPVQAKMHVGVWRTKAKYPRRETGNTTLTQYFGTIGKFTDIVQEQMRIMEPITRTRDDFPCVIDNCNNVAEPNGFECVAHHGEKIFDDDEFHALEMAEHARREYKMQQDAENEYESMELARSTESMNEAAFEAQQYCMNEAEDDDEAYEEAYQMPCVTRGCRNLCAVSTCEECEAEQFSRLEEAASIEACANGFADEQ
jgi:hypothetical protein